MTRQSTSRPPNRPAVMILAAWAGMLAAGPKARARPTVIRLATQVPRESPWCTALFRFAARVRKQTRGQVVFKIYAGGVAGTEHRAVRLMKRGNLQAAALSGAGMMALEPSARVFELPNLFQRYNEFGYVVHHMEGTMRQRLHKRGYQLLGLTTVGWIYLFSKQPIRDLADLRARTFWRWARDPLPSVVMTTAGVQTVSLKLRNVLAGLRSRKIDTVYGTPHVILAFGWNSQVTWVLDYHFLAMMGVFVMRKDVFDSLAPAHQKVLMANVKKYAREVNGQSANIDTRSMKAMRASGLRLCQPSSGLRKYFSRLGRNTRNRLVGRVIKPEDLRTVQKLLVQCRTTSCRF